jgi:hypothetical protein
MIYWTRVARPPPRCNRLKDKKRTLERLSEIAHASNQTKSKA